MTAATEIAVVGTDQGNGPVSADPDLNPGLKFSVFRDVLGKEIKRHEKSWPELVSVLMAPKSHARKSDCPLIKLGTFGDQRSSNGSLRTDSNLQEVCGIEGDYDGEKVEIAEAADTLERAGIKAFFYSTASSGVVNPPHSSGGPRWRVLVPLSQPVSPKLRARFVAKLNTVLGGILSSESFTASQTFYFRRVVGVAYECRNVDGRFIDLVADQLAETYPEKSKPVETANDSIAVADDGDLGRDIVLNEVSEKTIRDLERAIDALKPERAEDRASWIAGGIALKSIEQAGYSDEALALFLRFSGRCPEKFEYDDAISRWEGFKPDRSTYKKIFGWAKEDGWSNRAEEIIPLTASDITESIEVDQLMGLHREVIVANAAAKLVEASLEGIQQEQVLKHLKATTGFAIKALREEVGKARRAAPDDVHPKIGTNSPVATAKALIRERYMHHGDPTIWRWNGVFYTWQGDRYDTAIDEDVRAQIYQVFDGHRIDVPGRVPVDNVLDALKAHVNIPSTHQMPAWLIGVPPAPVNELIAVKNGLIHASTRKLYRHSPRFFSTGAADVLYSAEAPQPLRWLKFLNEVFPGDPDSVRALQHWFGYLLTQDTSQQKGLMIVGPPRCGKGTIARVLRALLGYHNCAGPTLTQLGRQFGLQGLIGKSLAIVADAHMGSASDSSAISDALLRISGEDLVSVERKHVGDWNGKLTTRFIVMTNVVPSIVDAGGALASRFIVLSISTSFLGREENNLTEKLLAELPGIFNWALDGLTALHAQGKFSQPASGLGAADDLKRNTTPILGFINDALEFDSEKWVSKDAIYSAYLEWCRREGKKFTLAKNTFMTELYANSDGRLKSQEVRVGSGMNSGRRIKVVRGVALVDDGIAHGGYSEDDYATDAVPVRGRGGSGGAGDAGESAMGSP